MENNNIDIIIKLLDEMKIGETQFQMSVITGECIAAIVALVLQVVVMIALIIVFKKINEEFKIKSNFKNLLKILKNKEEKILATRNINNEEEKKTPNDELTSIMQDIQKFLHSNAFWRNALTILIIWIEFKWIIVDVGYIFNSVTKVMQCVYSPEKILMDYLSQLF